MAKADTSNMDFFEKVGFTFGLWTASWNAFKTNVLTFIALYVIPVGAMLVALFLLLIPTFATTSDSTAVSAVGSIVSFAIMLAFLIVLLLLVPAQTITQLESAKGKEISIGDALSKSKQYIIPYIIAALIMIAVIVLPLIISFALVFVLIGILLIPLAVVWAIVAAFFVFLVPYIIVTENMSGYEAIKRSVEVTKAHWQWVLAILIVQFILSLVSYIPLIGFIISIITTIVYLCMPAIVYTKYIAKKEKAEEKKA
jgi:hypothetical protein